MNMINRKQFRGALCVPYPKKLLSIFPGDATDDNCYMQSMHVGNVLGNKNSL